jgi:hypothetical protein
MICQADKKGHKMKEIFIIEKKHFTLCFSRNYGGWLKLFNIRISFTKNDRMYYSERNKIKCCWCIIGNHRLNIDWRK